MSMTSFHRRTVATVAPIATVGSASPWVCGVCRTFLHTHDEIVAGDLGSQPGPRTICHSFISRRCTLRGTSQPCLAKISAQVDCTLPISDGVRSDSINISRGHG